MCTVCMEKYTLGNKYFPLCTELVHGESILRRLGDKPSTTVYSLNISIENREDYISARKLRCVIISFVL